MSEAWCTLIVAQLDSGGLSLIYVSIWCCYCYPHRDIVQAFNMFPGSWDWANFDVMSSLVITYVLYKVWYIKNDRDFYEWMDAERMVIHRCRREVSLLLRWLVPDHTQCIGHSVSDFKWFLNNLDFLPVQIQFIFYYLLRVFFRRCGTSKMIWIFSEWQDAERMVIDSQV